MVFVKVISSAVQKCIIGIITDLPIRCGEREQALCPAFF
jgi:hypothetical protein